MKEEAEKVAPLTDELNEAFANLPNSLEALKAFIDEKVGGSWAAAALCQLTCGRRSAEDARAGTCQPDSLEGLQASDDKKLGWALRQLRIPDGGSRLPVPGRHCSARPPASPLPCTLRSPMQTADADAKLIANPAALRQYNERCRSIAEQEAELERVEETRQLARATIDGVKASCGCQMHSACCRVHAAAAIAAAVAATVECDAVLPFTRRPPAHPLWPAFRAAGCRSCSASWRTSTPPSPPTSRQVPDSCMWPGRPRWAASGAGGGAVLEALVWVRRGICSSVLLCLPSNTR